MGDGSSSSWAPENPNSRESAGEGGGGWALLELTDAL